MLFSVLGHDLNSFHEFGIFHINCLWPRQCWCRQNQSEWAGNNQTSRFYSYTKPSSVKRSDGGWVGAAFCIRRACTYSGLGSYLWRSDIFRYHESGYSRAKSQHINCSGNRSSNPALFTKRFHEFELPTKLGKVYIMTGIRLWILL